MFEKSFFSRDDTGRMKVWQTKGVSYNIYEHNKITQTLFLQIFGHAAFIKQKVRWHSTVYMISIFHLQRLQR